MPRETTERRRLDDSGNGLYINASRRCRRVFGRRYCTPWLATKARLHFTSDSVDRLYSGPEAILDVLRELLGEGVVVNAVLQIISAVVTLQRRTVCEGDGSLNISILPGFAKAGIVVVPVAPLSCAGVLQALFRILF